MTKLILLQSFAPPKMDLVEFYFCKRVNVQIIFLISI